MSFEMPDEGDVVTHTKLNDDANDLYSRINNLNEDSILPNSLLPAHLPSALVQVAEKEFNDGEEHVYNDVAHSFPGHGEMSGWTVVGETLSTPDSLEVTFSPALQYGDENASGYANVFLVLCNINHIQMMDTGALDGYPGIYRFFWAVFALQRYDGSTWQHLAWTERIFSSELEDNICMHFLLDSTQLSGFSADSNVVKFRVVFGMTRGLGVGITDAEMILEDAQLIVFAFRAGEL